MTLFGRSRNTAIAVTCVTEEQAYVNTSMPYGRKVVLHCPRGYHARLDEMVEQFIRDGVVFVGVVGEDCAKIEDIIDELVLGDASDENRFILTSSHPYESLEKAVHFAQSLTDEYAGEVQVVEL